LGVEVRGKCIIAGFPAARRGWGWGMGYRRCRSTGSGARSGRRVESSRTAGGVFCKLCLLLLLLFLFTNALLVFLLEWLKAIIGILCRVLGLSHLASCLVHGACLWWFGFPHGRDEFGDLRLRAWRIAWAWRRKGFHFLRAIDDPGIGRTRRVAYEGRGSCARRSRSRGGGHRRRVRSSNRFRTSNSSPLVFGPKFDKLEVEKEKKEEK
jgi:hypothetical protein